MRRRADPRAHRPGGGRCERHRAALSHVAFGAAGNGLGSRGRGGAHVALARVRVGRVAADVAHGSEARRREVHGQDGGRVRSIETSPTGERRTSR